MTFNFLLASTTHYGLTCAQSLTADDFVCHGVLTPPPRPLGRKQILTPTPVQTWAQNQTPAPPIFFINQKITPDIKDNLPPVDFLIVVDFGYYIPQWLIDFPQFAALNIHPSALPQYRGASPGQFVIKNGDSHSAVSLILLHQKMDSGDLLTQIPFAVNPTWNTTAYYDYAFRLVTQNTPSILAQTLSDFATQKVTPQPQSGIPSFAPKISKKDAFISWDDFQFALAHPQATQALALERQIRAFHPWPLSWTLAPTKNGPKRLQLLTAHLENHRFVLDQVKLEGETTKNWPDVTQRLAAAPPISPLTYY
jgi:methionyl-tRNA formyltransferase